MSRTTKKTDMGHPEDGMLWNYTYMTEPLLSSELARLSFATSLGDTSCVSFQPCPHPDHVNQDRYIVQDLPLQNGTWSFRGVFDGHAGHDTVDYASQKLPKLIHEALQANFAKDNLENGLHDISSISDILTNSFVSFDNSIREGVLALFPDTDFISKLSDSEIRSIINDQERGGKNAMTMLRCMRGTTALISLIDPSKSNIWVASLGDCQAVLGTKSPSGKWTSSILSSYHNGMDGAEADRIRSEHPNEPECMLNDRVLGAIAVTRALGDHLFKLPKVYTERIFVNVHPGFHFSAKLSDFLGRNLTPPYLSNCPDVCHINLKSDDSTQKRLIMCSDGLIDLYQHKFDELSDMADIWVKTIGDIKSEDNNPALALLRDAVGGEDIEEVSRMITVELDFKWMDDTTILVQEL